MWGREGAIGEKNVSGNDDIARAAQGKVIGIAVHIYIYVYVCGPKKIELYFSD